jgi:hypothetical protein
MNSAIKLFLSNANGRSSTAIYFLGRDSEGGKINICLTQHTI